MSVPNLKESVSSPVPQIYTRFYIFARVPRDESRRVSSNKLSFQLSFKAATGLKCADCERHGDDHAVAPCPI